LENSKRKNLGMIENDVSKIIGTLENHKKKTDLIYREYEDLKNKFERQNKIYETEIINKKQDNEQVLIYSLF